MSKSNFLKPLAESYFKDADLYAKYFWLPSPPDRTGV
jgi:hypothetical protein